MPSTTSRLALPYPLGGDAPNVPNDIENLANALDTIIIKWQTGTLASRPAAGHAGFAYLATDQTGADGNLGQWYLDTGSQWILINPGPALAGSVTTSAVGDASVVGTSTIAARQDHKHGRESYPGSGGTKGSATTVARGDHTHNDTVRITHTYALAGPVSAQPRWSGSAPPPDFFPGVPAGQAASLGAVRFGIMAGTNVTFQLVHNTGPITSVGTLTATTSTQLAAVGVSVTDGDTLGINIISATSDAVSLAVSFYLDITTTTAAS